MCKRHALRTTNEHLLAHTRAALLEASSKPNQGPQRTSPHSRYLQRPWLHPSACACKDAIFGRPQGWAFGERELSVPQGLRAAAPARASPGCDRVLLLALSVRRLRLRLRLLRLLLLLLPLLPLLLLLRLGLRRMLSHLRRLAIT